jgi:hypothetical protein
LRLLYEIKMFAVTTHATSATLLLGSVVLAFSLTMLALAILRFDWLKRKMPFLCRWGGASLFPIPLPGMVLQPKASLEL